MEIRGNTNEEKFRSVAKALERLHKKLLGVRSGSPVAISPLSFYASEVPEDGVVARYLFPAKGWLSRYTVRYQDLDVGKETDDLKITIYKASSTLDKTLPINMKLAEGDIDFPIEAGNILEVSAKKAPVWVAFIYSLYLSGKEVRNARVEEDARAETGPETV